MSYPATPGYKVDGPSKDAARAMKPRASKLRDHVYYMIEKCADGLTTDECAERLGKSVLSIRPRFTELLAMGKIEDSGRRQMNASGRVATVWRIARV